MSRTLRTRLFIHSEYLHVGCVICRLVAPQLNPMMLMFCSCCVLCCPQKSASIGFSAQSPYLSNSLLKVHFSWLCPLECPSFSRHVLEPMLDFKGFSQATTLAVYYTQLLSSNIVHPIFDGFHINRYSRKSGFWISALNLANNVPLFRQIYNVRLRKPIPCEIVACRAFA